MADWISPDRESRFPNLSRSVYQKTSDENDLNNCVGFAARDDGWWQPPVERWHYWPQGAPLDFRLSSFVRAYELEGFEMCADSVPELGFERVALYAYSNGEFAHVARLNEDGSWTSKLGEWEDIQHMQLSNLEGSRPAYGQVRTYMKRRLT